MEPLQPGDPRRVGPYRVLARIGAGGMGVVYLGRSAGGRAVAVKVVRERFAADPEFRTRFHREVAAARTVNGALTAPVLDADPEAGLPWLATAYLPGLSLREAVALAGALPPAALRTLAAGLAEALTDIHRAGLAHRDLKPANIMLTRGGPRVIDFGIARPRDATVITQVGSVLGTPGFMSPEQAAGGVAGPAGDVFTLGAVLVFAGTGREPFGPDTAPDSERRLREGRADLGGITEPWLSALVVECLRVRPEERPTAAGLLDRLDGEAAAAGPLDAARWLPALIVEEIDRRTAQAQQLLSAGSAAPQARPVARLSLMDEATLGPATLDPAGPTDLTDPADPADPFPGAAAEPASRRPGRRLLLLGAAGVVAAAGTVALTRATGGGGGEGRRAPTGRAVPPSSPARPTATAPPKATPRWRVKVSNYYPDVFTAGGSADSLAGGVLLATTDEREIHALDPLTGTVRWKRPATLTHVVTGGRVFVAQDTNPRLTAVDPRSGRTRWEYTVPIDELPLAVADNGSVTCFGYERVRALDSGDGSPRWVTDVSAKGGLAAVPGLVVAADSALVGLDAHDGRKRWTYPIEKGGVPQIGGGLVFVGDWTAGVLHAVRAADGTAVWRQRTSVLGPAMRYAGGVLYVTAGASVSALDAATGALRWSRQLPPSSQWMNTLGLSGGTVYIGAGNRTVYALDTADGRITWTCPEESAQRSAPVGMGGLAFIGSREGYVEALTPPGGGCRACA